MKIIKSKNVQETLLNIVLVVGGLFLVAALVHYGSNKTMQKDMMVNGGSSMSKPAQPQPTVSQPQQPQQTGGQIEASTSDVFDSCYSAVSGASVSEGPVEQKRVMNPNELLPKQQNANSALMNPGMNPNQGLAGKNFLSAENHIGINTVGNSLRNANLQLRSEPANPQQPVGPWNNSNIEPDTMRKPLEIGSN